MTRTDYKQLNELSITEIETIFAGYETLVDALEAQTHTWRRPTAQVTSVKRSRGLARLFTYPFMSKVAKRT